MSNSPANANTSTFAWTRVRLAFAALLAAASCFLLSALLAAAPASAVCPNDVFRTGPSAKLPDCRAYELVTPAYTGGIKPQGTNFSNMYHGFEFLLLNDAGSSLVFNTSGAALSGTAGNGFNDRYRAKRTATGWVTELAGPTAEETSRLTPGPVSDDHGYEFLNAGLNEFNLEPESTLQAPYGGRVVDILQKPGGQYELIAIGSLGSDRTATGHRITPGATHVIFSTKVPLEPNASPAGMTTIYDRTPGGPTQVVSLLPDGSAPTSGGVDFLGSSTDGNHVVFRTRSGSFDFDNARWWVRSNNSVTKEVVRAGGVAVGEELTCKGGGAATIAYQWLRNGTPIGGATNATYTPVAADEGTVVQCRVEATGSEGTGFRTSLPPHYIEPFAGKDFPFARAQATFLEVEGPTIQTGETVTCEATPAAWANAPTFSYQWFLDGAEIPGATGSTYSVAPADEGKSLFCRVTASNDDGAVVDFSNARGVQPVLPAVEPATEGLGDPAISNLTDAGDAPETGDELSCSPGTWTGSPSFAYQWLRNGAPIGGATASTYTVAAADEGTSLQCLVTATEDAITQAISDPLVADPQPAEAPPLRESWSAPAGVSGGSEVGDSLNCNEGVWTGNPTLGFQWMRDGGEIAGATEQSYTLVSADLGSVVQCRVTATNSGGSTVETFAGGSSSGPHFITAEIPNATAKAEGGTAEMTFNGLFGGHVFYSDGPATGPGNWEQAPADLLSYDIASGTTTRITDVGDAKYSHVSRDGSHVYFVSPSEIGGEGNSGEPNLYVWSRADDSTTYIATVEPSDVVLRRNSQEERGTNLASWKYANEPEKDSVVGLGASDTRSTPDGSVFLFQSSAPLTGFENIESEPEDCLDKFTGGERCPQAYLYDTATEELTCVSCPPGGGTGSADGFAEFYEWGVISDLNPPNNLSDDGTTVVFESSEDLLPQDGNERKDVYRWKKGEGLALISTGQATTPSLLYAVTPNASDIAFLTTEKLVPHDANGGTERIYDARVNGGFPPDESTVTEPCTGDACQGNPKAAPEAPSIPSTSLVGGGNVKEKLRCPKGKRKVVRKGKERCIKRKGKHRKGNKQRQGNKRQNAGASRGVNR